MTRGTIVIFIAILSFAIMSAGYAAPVYNSGNAHYYELISEGNSWADAKTAAEGLSYLGLTGHLVTITSQTEMDWILSTWDPSGYPVWDGSYPLFNCWIGGYQLSNQSAPNVGWNWVTGEPWGYTYWYSSEPNDNAGSTPGVEDNEENFAAFVPEAKWYDYGGGYAPKYMVEYETAGPVVPEPSTLLLLGLGLFGTGFFKRRRK